MNKHLETPFLYFAFVAENGIQQHWTFTHPVQIIQAYQKEEVLPAMSQIEEGVKKGFYAAGYIAYEAAPAFDPALMTHPGKEWPLLWFALFREPGKNVPVFDRGEYRLGEWKPSVSRLEYGECIEKIHQAIARGETYQVNYTLRLRAPFQGDEWAFFQDLVAAQEAPYAAYLNLGPWSILSASPELFFRKKGNRLTARPMKGTARRGRYVEEDLRMRKELARSAKNRAENVMIVDLLRNDLGRLAKEGGVAVPRLFTLERYPTVWQMTSTVTAEIPADTTWTEILTALFPCGSITGAPKVQTMRWIATLESSPRGVYCGTIGFITPQGDAAFSVAIRTVTLERKTGQAEYGVGGGITWDSTAEGEYEEALTKAKLLTERRPPFSLVETMRWERGEYLLLERHLQRLLGSADYFGIPADEGEIRQYLQEWAQTFPPGTRRVRLLLSQKGEISVESSPLDGDFSLLPLSPPFPLHPVRLAAAPISRENPFLYHKTTCRQVYEMFRQKNRDVFDTLLWNEEGEITEFTIGNIVLEVGGEKVTPALDCGLLPGTLRTELLERGYLRECVLTLEDLQRAERIWLINSVRGWVPVTLS